MMMTWDEVLVDRLGGLGNWVTMPDNGWGALVAYLAGPGHVQAVPRKHDPIRVTCVVDGAEEIHHETASAEEIAQQAADVASYLHRYDVPAPPFGMSLQVRLSPGLTRLNLERALNAATMSSAPDGEPRAERLAIERLLPELLGS